MISIAQEESVSERKTANEIGLFFITTIIIVIIIIIVAVSSFLSSRHPSIMILLGHFGPFGTFTFSS